ncbi:hypothetical protein H9Y04_27925 [Streptomyces sp. TRM66268-LWL]|uniref:Secreted protein n=1 Tax=Streptomyces polyasparticus TaxID=2767826 RepID=A0ABR7SLL2_9ACTN|nr:hypothetical protein [Streptomyces polyasparticus]MBC9716370.1 hypothetical protein [Streptomyces polyasparticus]
MKIRHVRAVAVVTVALIALTGARHSSGGGCDDNNSSGSADSRSVGKSDDSGDSGDSGTSGATTDGTTTTGGSTTSGQGSKPAGDDLSIVSCKLTKGQAVVRVRAANDSPSATYSYWYGVEVTGQDGRVLYSAYEGFDSVAPKTTQDGGVTMQQHPAPDTKGATCALTVKERTRV